MSMSRNDRTDIWMPIGGLGALTLGIILIPLRTLTSASNLAFAFIALTIVVAELGGRAAAVVTAVASAMSLNFFLTEPYLTLIITKPDDLIAFFAMAACGLIAAAFGRRREHLSDAAEGSKSDLLALRHLAKQLEAHRPLTEVLDHLRRSFGLRRVAVRDASGQPVATSPREGAPPPIPEVVLDSTLLAVGEHKHSFGRRGLRLPRDGGRVPVSTDCGVAFVDLWEEKSEGLSVNACHALSAAVSIIGIELSRQKRP